VAESDLEDRMILPLEPYTSLMPFNATWHELVNHLDELSEGASLVTPLSHRQFQISNIQEQRVIISFDDEDGYQPLQREQFETLYERIHDEPTAFELDRLPPDADPYPAVLSVHPRYEIDEDAGTITHTQTDTVPSLLDPEPEPAPGDDERSEPDLALYPDLLLLVDALERADLNALDALETSELINLYTLLSDVQRGANDLRKDVTDLLLPRLHHDQPISGQYGSVQRTSRRRKSLKDDEAVLDALEATGIEQERVLGVDRQKVDDALDVTELSEEAVYDIDESAYVRKAEVDEDMKASRLQGLKDRLAATEGQDAAALQEEIEDLEERINELTSFSRATDV
jgi:polyhydroxyalkanoate synthesis regulator phasin